MTLHNKQAFIAKIRLRNEKDFESENTRRPLEGLIEAAGPMPWLYVFELAQNAIDAGARRIRIRPEQNGVVFEHDGPKPLEQRGVDSLCGANRPTKDPSTVGFMGVGFKSVFRRFRSASVSGFGWRFRFDIGTEEGSFGARLLRWVDAVLPRWDDSIPDPEPPWTTRFHLSGIEGNEQTVARDVDRLAAESDPAPIAMLCLRGLRELDAGDAPWIADYDEEGGTVRISRGEKKWTWLTFRQEYQPSLNALRRLAEVRELRQPDSETDRKRLVVGLVSVGENTLPNPPLRGRIYATLPTEEDLPFGMHIQADWFVNVSRQALRAVTGDPWQEEIVAQIPHLVAQYLTWVAASEDRQTPSSYELLQPLPTESSHQVEQIVIGDGFREDLIAALQPVAFMPVHSANGERLRNPGHVRTLPNGFPPDLTINDGWRVGKLFGAELADDGRFGVKARQFCEQLGWLLPLSPGDIAWPDGLAAWWDSLDGVPRASALLAVWVGLTSERAWSDLPCFLTQSGSWVRAAELVWLGEGPFTGEPGVTELLPVLRRCLPRLDRVLRFELRQKLQRPEPTLRQRAFIVEGWLKGRESRPLLADLVETAFAAHQAATVPPKSALIGLMRLAKHRSRPDLVKFVLADDRMVRPIDAILADPYVPDGAARRRVFNTRPALSLDYSGIDGLDQAFLLRVGLGGSMEPIRDTTQTWSQSDVANRLSIEVAAVQPANSAGWTIVNYTWPDSVVQAGARDLALLLQAQHPKLASHGRIKAYSKYHDSKITIGRVLCSWVQALQARPWVPCKDGTCRKPADVLPADNRDYEEAPVADLTNELVTLLQREGVRFGISLLKSPALRRLQRIGAQLGEAELALLLEECIEASGSIDDGAQQLRQALGELRIRGVPIGRLVRRAGTGGTSRSSLGNWVVPTSELHEALQQALQRLPVNVPDTTTAAQALGYLSHLWADEKAPRSGLSAYAYDYVLQDDEGTRRLHNLAQQDNPPVRLHDGEGWRALGPALYLDDLPDERLTPLLPPDLVRIDPAQLGTEGATRGRAAEALGIRSLADKYPVKVLYALALEKWLPWLQALLHSIASRPNSAPTAEAVSCRKLSVEIANTKKNVAAYLDGKRLYLKGRPDEFAEEAACLLLDHFSLSQSGKIGVRLAMALQALEQEQMFLEKASQIAQDLRVEFIPPVAQLELVGPAEASSSARERMSGSSPALPEGQRRPVTQAVASGIDYPQPLAARHGEGRTVTPDAREPRTGEPRTAADRFGILVKPSRGHEAAHDASKPPEVGEPDGVDPGSDAASRRAVMEYERSRGRTPHEMDFSQWGFDIESADSAGTVRRIEVKGAGGMWIDDASVLLSRRQLRDALDYDSTSTTYWLYVVDQLDTSSPAIFPIHWPSQALEFGFCASHWRALAGDAR